jgi:hypothetical protein
LYASTCAKAKFVDALVAYWAASYSMLLPLPFILKRILLFAVAAILSRQAPQTTYRIHAHLYYSLVEPSFP